MPLCASLPVPLSVQAHPFFAGLDFDAVYERKIAPLYVPTVRSSADISNFDKVFTRVSDRPFPRIAVAWEGKGEAVCALMHCSSLVAFP